MVLYFSGTGNSKYCAEKIASKIDSEVCSINNMMKKQIIEIDAKERQLLGIVCPTIILICRMQLRNSWIILL